MQTFTEKYKEKKRDELKNYKRELTLLEKNYKRNYIGYLIANKWNEENGSGS